MIRLENIEKTFRSSDRTVRVIDGVSETIAEGCFFTLLGPSGCGKTTTLRVVAGLESHDKGRVWFGEQLVSDPEARVFTPTSRRDIGMVFQSYAIWPHMNVFANVAYPLTTGRQKVAAAEQKRRVMDAIELVGLGHLQNAPATSLSGGQQQRVALARALVAHPRILLLDEPLSNLDALLRERMRSEVTQIQKKIGITSIYVTHDRAEALSMSDVVAVMNNGRIEMTGTPATVYERPNTLFVAQFLGHCNFLPATIRSRESATAALVDTTFGTAAVEMTAVPDSGAPVSLLLRPEDLVEATPGMAGLRIEARMRRLTYYGERFDCEVEVAGEPLRFTAQRPPTTHDDRLTLALRKPVAWALPA